ncbi:MAG: hypothetical protein ACI83Y_001228 [Candidatus Azotimanducaceae bacterium]
MTDPNVPSSADALDLALAAASRDSSEPYRLDEGRCTISVPLPPGLIEGLEALEVGVRLSGDIVSFTSPLASLTEGALPSEVATALLRRQFFASQTEGSSFALADREDVLVAQYHWMPTVITPEEFSAIFGRFVSSAMRLRDEVTNMAAQGAPIQVLSSSN